METKIRYTLTVPLNDNDGEPLAHVHEMVCESLSLNFEGFSSWHGFGYWGGEHAGSEPVVYYVIDADGLAFLRILRDLAHYVKREGKQDAVYLTRQIIEAELI